MTVAELQEALTKFPGDWSVVTGWHRDEQVTSVEAGTLTTWEVRVASDAATYPTVVLEASQL